MEIKKNNLPKIGKRFIMQTTRGRKIMIILHKNGHRDIYHFQAFDDDEPNFSLHLNDEEARKVGGILLNVY